MPDVTGNGQPTSVEATINQAVNQQTTQPAAVQSQSVQSGAEATKTYVVDGQPVQLTEREVTEIVQKNRAADRRLQEASELLKTSQFKTNLGDAVMRAKSGDLDAWKTIGQALGVAEDEVAGMLSGQGGQVQQISQGTVRTPAGQEIPFEQLPKPIREFFGRLQEAQVDPVDYANKSMEGIYTSQEQKIHTEVLKELDTDPNLRYFIRNADQAEVMKQLVLDAMLRRVQRSGGRETYGPELRRSAIQEVRATVQRSGMQPMERTKTNGLLALPASSSPGLGQERHPETPTYKRPHLFKTSDDELAQATLERLRQLATEQDNQVVLS